jgi:putative DNA primase/helicase
MTEDRATVRARLKEAGISLDGRFVECFPGQKGANQDKDRLGSIPSTNYGVYATARDTLVLVDVDDYGEDVDEEAVQALAHLPATFEVETPHGGTHRYYSVEMDDSGRMPSAVLKAEFGAENPGPSWGEVRVMNQYVVGPGSMLKECDKEWCDSCATPDGGRYTVAENREIATLDVSDLVAALRSDPQLSPDEEDEDGSESEEVGEVPDDVDGRLEKALESDDKLRRLWNGSTSGYGNDRSRAECALAAKLGWWFGNDKSTVYSLMDRSDAEKWAERPDDTYRESVLEAVDQNTDSYTPGGKADPPSTKELIARYSDEFDTAEDVPDDVFGEGEVEKAATDGGATTGARTGDTPPYASALEPSSIYILAALDEEEGEEISDLTDREKAAHTWEVIRRNPDVHIRVRRDNGSLWAYDGGVWKREGERALRHAARQTLGATNYGQNVLTELKGQVRADPTVEVEAETFGLPAGKVAVANGLLDLEAAADRKPDALRTLKPTDYALTRIPHEWEPEAEYDEWHALVEEWAEDGRADALQEYVGYCLEVGAMPIHRALLVVGNGANGKGTFLNAVRTLLGDENTTSIELQRLANESDALARLYGSVANIDDDLSARKLGRGLGMFKKLVGDDRVEGRHLYEEAFEFDATAKHLYAANEVPDVSDDVGPEDEAFWRRWLLVEFPNHYPPHERDPNLSEKVTSEEYLQKILAWAVDGRARLMEKGYFTNESRYSQSKRERWQSWGDSVAQFIEKCVEKDTDAERLTTGQAHRRYAAWCRENNEKPVGQQQFTSTMKGEEVGYSSSVRIDGTVQRGYKALGLSEDVPDLEDTPERGGKQSSLDL